MKRSFIVLLAIGMISLNSFGASVPAATAPAGAVSLESTGSSTVGPAALTPASAEPGSAATVTAEPASTTAVSSESEAPAATASAAKTMRAADVRIPIGKTGKFINLRDLSTIKVADFEQLTGKKLGFFNLVEFKLAQRQLRHSIKKDGTLDSKKLARLARAGYYDEDGSFHFGGFALGFFLGLIGVLIAYLINDDNHHRRVKWAWLGFAIYVGVLLIVVAATAG